MTFFGKLDRIADQVFEDLLQKVAVEVGEERVGRAYEFEQERLLMRQRRPCSNSSNKYGMNVSSMPMPVSAMRMDTWSRSCSTATRT